MKKSIDLVPNLWYNNNIKKGKETKVSKGKNLMEKKTQMNERQVAVIKALKASDKALTLAEISGIVGFEVKSGTTNTLIKNGIIKVVGKRTVVCECCGHKHTVNEYTIGD